MLTATLSNWRYVNEFSSTFNQAMYNAFISYSHSADDRFAPALQEALQKFAKPWYKKRNLEIFRDESSLSASPHLWNTTSTKNKLNFYFNIQPTKEFATSISRENWALAMEITIQKYCINKSL